MLLTIDVGNTRTSLAFWDGEEIKHRYNTPSDPNASYDDCAAKLKLFLQAEGLYSVSVESAILSAVSPRIGEIYRQLVEAFFFLKPIVVGPHLKTGVALKVDNPREVGADLVADVAGALDRYGPKTIIVDMGTANKVLLIDENGTFAGCTIGVGLGLGHQALVHGTAALSEVSLRAPKKVLGKNTADCMNSALTYGTAFELRGLAEAIEKEAGYPCQKVLTGGYASFVKDLLQDFTYDPDLLMRGLYRIAKRREEK